MDIIMIMLRTIYDIYLVAHIVSVSVSPLIILLITTVLINSTLGPPQLKQTKKEIKMSLWN